MIVIAAGCAVITAGVCGVYHDDAIYVATAKSIAQGHGYRLIDLPDGPPQTKYPVLYPLALAAVWRLWPTFPDNLLAMQAMSVLAAALGIVLSYFYATRVQRCRKWVAALALTMCAASPTFVYFSVQTLSELPFLLALVASLWIAAGELERSPSSRLRDFLVGATLAVPALVRIIGAAIVVPLTFAVWRRRGRALWLAIGAGLPVLTWIAWAAGAPNAESNVGRYYVDYSSWLADAARGGIWRVVAGNALIGATASADWLPAGWKGPLPAIAWPLIGLFVWAAIARRARGALRISLFAYLAIVLFWPWPSSRFIILMWPLILPIAWQGLERRCGRAIVGVASVAIIAGNLAALRHVAVDNRATGYPWIAGQSRAVRWTSFERLFSWLRLHTAASDTLTSGLDSMLFLYTDRPSIRAFAPRPAALFYGDRSELPIGSDRDFVELLERYRPRFLVQTPMPGFAEEAPFNEMLDRLRQSRPLCLASVYQDESDPRFNVFEVNTALCRLN